MIIYRRCPFCWKLPGHHRFCPEPVFSGWGWHRAMSAAYRGEYDEAARHVDSFAAGRPKEAEE